MKVLEPPPTTTARRVQRLRHRRRRTRRTSFLSVAVFLVVALASAWVLREVGSDGPGSRRSGPAASGPKPSALTLLAVRTGREPLVAVIASGGDPEPAAIAVPTSMVVNLPGQGEGRFREAVDQPASYLGLVGSNVLGSWIDHVVVLDLDGLAAVVDRAGGALVGGAPQSGRAVADSFAVATANPAIRWREVLESLVLNGIRLETGDLVDAVDPEGAAQALAKAAGALPDGLPSVRGEGGLLRPDDEAIEDLVRTSFGRKGPPPVPLIVLNGTGAAGLGQSVAERLVPEGFRVVVSQNAARFDHATTQIVVTDEGDLSAAERVRELLGVGTVVVSGVPSGLADVTIVLGRDYRTE